ncbi:MAG: hypothetical protein AAFZ65_18575, partial [Planctomycetota bacterium]
MATKKRNRSRKPFNKGHFNKQHAQDEGVLRIDFETLPKDLDEEAVDELVEALPKSTRKTKPKAVAYDQLQAMNQAELHEVADKEKVDLESTRRRRDVSWAITQARLAKHVPVTVEGCLEVVDD